jgi:hypothetical protein
VIKVEISKFLAISPMVYIRFISVGQISTCSGLTALDYANTKFSQDYSTMGVGMVVCAHYKFIQPNGVGDLQKGEQCVAKHLYVFFFFAPDKLYIRYANMDYIFTSVLHHHDPLLPKIISYNIVCQWWKLLME